MRTRIFTFLAALLSVVLAQPAVSQSVSRSQAEVLAQLDLRERSRDLNLGLATTELMLANGINAAFTVSEQAQQRDLNGDGDQNDMVVHVFNAFTGTVRNLGLKSTFLESGPLLQGRVLAFWAQEDAGDLNGDGDVSDAVLHIYDTLRGTLTNTRTAGAMFPGTPFTDGQRLVFSANEARQRQDLNRDGDLADEVPHVFDLLTGRLQNIGLATFGVFPSTVVLGGRWIGVAAFEGETFFDGVILPGTDLNDNGVKSDQVVHLFDTLTGRVVNLRVALGGLLGPAQFDTFEAGFKVGAFDALVVALEGKQGKEGRAGVDLNGDGDVADAVLQRVDLLSGEITTTGIAVVSAGEGTFPGFGLNPTPFVFQDGLAVFNVREADQRKDLNGDEDTDDVVLQVLSTRTGQLRTLQVSGSLFFSDSLRGRAALFMSEPFSGRDFNTDGDRDDFVLALADLRGREPRIVNTGLAVTTLPANGDDFEFFFAEAYGLQISDNLVSFLVPEPQQGNRDLNGDGDATDTVLHITDLSSFTTRNTGLNGAQAFRSAQAPLLPLSDRHALVPVDELRQGNRDLNGDGDTQDIVLQRLEMSSGNVTNTGVAVATDNFRFIGAPPGFPLVIRGETFVAALVDEGGLDLNSDGDTLDRVFHLLDVSSGTVTNTGLASGASGFQFNDVDLDFYFAAINGMSGGPFTIFSGFAGPSVPTDDGPGLGDAFTFLVSERDQGNVDLNGDGDTNDLVVHATRLSDRDRNGRLDFAEPR